MQRHQQAEFLTFNLEVRKETSRLEKVKINYRLANFRLVTIPFLSAFNVVAIVIWTGTYTTVCYAIMLFTDHMPANRNNL